MLTLGKKGLSNLIAYVLLISISISLSVLVYSWLKFYVTQQDVAECPEGVNLIISNYECVAGVNGYLNLTLKNKGLFSVDGYTLSVHNRTDAKFGLYTIDNIGGEIPPGGAYNKRYDFAEIGSFSDLTLVDVAPYVGGSDVTHCDSYVVQEIDCN